MENKKVGELTQSGFNASDENIEEDLRTWLIYRISKGSGISFDKIDVYEPFVSYGMGSLQAITIMGDLEKKLKIGLSPTLIWDYPNIQALVRYLSQLKIQSASK